MSPKLWSNKTWLGDNIFKPIGKYIDKYNINGPHNSRVLTHFFELIDKSWPNADWDVLPGDIEFKTRLDKFIKDQKDGQPMDADLSKWSAKSRIIRDFLVWAANSIEGAGGNPIREFWKKMPIDPPSGFRNPPSGFRKRKKNSGKRNVGKRNAGNVGGRPIGSRKRNTRKRNTRKRNTRKRNTRSM